MIKLSNKPGSKDSLNQKEAMDLQSLMNGEFQFEDSGEEEVFHQQDLVLLKPLGISVSTDPQNPFLLLRDEETQKLTLPVAINPLEAGVTLAQSNSRLALATPYRFMGEILKSLDITLRQCVFVQMKGPVQYVRIYFSGHPKLDSIKLRADEAMSLCLHFGVPIFASREFIQRSRQMRAHIEEVNMDRIPNSIKMTKSVTYLN